MLLESKLNRIKSLFRGNTIVEPSQLVVIYHSQIGSVEGVSTCYLGIIECAGHREITHWRSNLFIEILSKSIV